LISSRQKGHADGVARLVGLRALDGSFAKYAFATFITASGMRVAGAAPSSEDRTQICH
jgi:hypothetical protein